MLLHRHQFCYCLSRTARGGSAVGDLDVRESFSWEREEFSEGSWVGGKRTRERAMRDETSCGMAVRVETAKLTDGPERSLLMCH